jgi:hypothetical protein
MPGIGVRINFVSLTNEKMKTKDKYPDSVLAFLRMLLKEPMEITDYPVRYVIHPTGFEFCGPIQEHRSAF